MLAARAWRSCCTATWPLGRRGMAMSKEVVTGASYVKGGSDPPLLPDSDYPDWLWDIMKPKEPLFSLQRKLGPERNIETIPLPEALRLIKLETRVDIKERNQKKAKK